MKNNDNGKIEEVIQDKVRIRLLLSKRVQNELWMIIQ